MLNSSSFSSLLLSFFHHQSFLLHFLIIFLMHMFSFLYMFCLCFTHFSTCFPLRFYIPQACSWLHKIKQWPIISIFTCVLFSWNILQFLSSLIYCSMVRHLQTCWSSVEQLHCEWGILSQQLSYEDEMIWLSHPRDNTFKT